MTPAPADDLRHRPEPGARMRDSLFWQLALPEERLSLQCYLFLSGTGSCGWHLAVWGEGGARLAFETGFTRLPDEADLDDVEVDGLRLRQPEPLRRAELALEREGVAVELAFMGAHDPFSYCDNPDGLPAWFAADRYEQTGRLTGRVRVGERVIAVDHPAHRDHSWGVRDWTAAQDWIWFVAYTASGAAVQGWSWRTAEAAGAAGYVLRDGRAVPVARIDARPLFDATGAPVALEATVFDTDGVATRVRLESYGTLELPDDRNGVLVRESGCRAWIDGEAGAGQWENEGPQVTDA